MLRAIAAEPDMAGRALAGRVSQKAVSELPALSEELAHVALIDYGVKSSIVRILRESGARVTIFPWDAPAADMLAVRSRTGCCWRTARAIRRRCRPAWRRYAS